LLIAAPGAAQVQTPAEGFVTGAAALAWETWQAAMQAILDHNPQQAETLFGQLLAEDPSPLRIALLADHTVQRTAAGGAILLLEQDLEAGAAGPNGQAIGQRLELGREQMNEADDGWYFCQIGRFDVADANFRALLASDPDPVALLELAERVPKRREILIQLTDHPTVGESVRAILRLLARGELAVKADLVRIKENIERLGGPPRGFENAVEALKDSGEHAIPFLVQYLRDPAKKDLLRPIVRCLPLIDRPAVNPLVMALRMDDPSTKRYIVEALGKIGYAQAVPYLLQLRQDSHTPEVVRSAVDEALDALQQRGVAVDRQMPAASAFFELAQEYYADKPSLAADSRLETANVWYWRDNLVQNVPVPTAIFNEIMCMRCCEEALRLDPGLRPALALWLAANFRREAELRPDQVDPTRPAGYPPAAYFAQSAGPQVCLATLERAIQTRDPAVALGAIEALRKTAGPASLVGDVQQRLPLAEALSFPDRMVRIQAALALAYARPTRPFFNYQNLMPVLCEALSIHAGVHNALVVDPDSASATALVAALRGQGYEVLSDASLYDGLQKVRDQLPAIDVILIASDIQKPGLTEGLSALRGEFRFAATPVVLITKPGHASLIRDLRGADHRLAAVSASPEPADLERAIALVSRAVGAKPITPELGAGLAMEAAEALRQLALTDNPVFNVSDAEAALLDAFKTHNVDLRLVIAETLGYLGSGKAQGAIASLALDPGQPEEMRVKMFLALAEAAKRRGNLLAAEQVQQIVKIAEGEPNLIIRQAASCALGALNLPGEPGSAIVRNQYQG